MLSSPLPPGGPCVLRMSLNTPVVAIEGLPVGPAAASLAVHAGAQGRLVTLALRSVRTGQLLLLRPEERWDGLHGPQLAIEAALSFAESLGFLFDEDPIAGRDAEEAARLWWEFLVAGGLELPDPEALRCEAPVPPSAPLLSKFRFLARTPLTGHLVAPPPAERPVRADLWIRALSRF